MSRMRRSAILVRLRVAGYHADSAEFTRLLCENRISYETAAFEYDKGHQQRRAGVACNCAECHTGEPQPGPTVVCIRSTEQAAT